MNSKYAPIVALTALIIIVVAALGWFLLIKPRFSDAAEIRTQASEVDQNIAVVQAATAQLSTYEQALAEYPSLDDSVALNLPPTTDMEAIRARITDAAAAAKVAIVSTKLDTSYLVDGWEIPPQSRVSSSIAQLFATGPVHKPGAVSVPTEPDPASTAAAAPDPNAYKPVVVADAEPGPVVTDLYGIPITMQVTGSYPQTVAFLKQMTGPDQQIFLIYESTQEARNSDASTLQGVPDAKDGDVILTVTGAFYTLSPDTTVVDDDPLEPVSPGGTSPFAPGKAAPNS